MSTPTWPARQPTLTDGHVLLRPWQSEDADAVFDACQDPLIQRFTNVPVPYLREHADFFVTTFARHNWANQTGAGFAVTDDAGDVLGACGLVGVDAESRRSGVGYWIARWARGRGVASRALQLVSDWALTDVGLRQVYADIENENPASMRVAEHAGFRLIDIPPRIDEHRGVPRMFLTLVRSTGDA